MTLSAGALSLFPSFKAAFIASYPAAQLVQANIDYNRLFDAINNNTVLSGRINEAVASNQLNAIVYDAANTYGIGTAAYSSPRNYRMVGSLAQTQSQGPGAMIFAPGAFIGLTSAPGTWQHFDTLFTVSHEVAHANNHLRYAQLRLPVLNQGLTAIKNSPAGPVDVTAHVSALMQMGFQEEANAMILAWNDMIAQHNGTGYTAAERAAFVNGGSFLASLLFDSAGAPLSGITVNPTGTISLNPANLAASQAQIARAPNEVLNYGAQAINDLLEAPSGQMLVINAATLKLTDAANPFLPVMQSLAGQFNIPGTHRVQDSASGVIATIQTTATTVTTGGVTSTTYTTAVNLPGAPIGQISWIAHIVPDSNEASVVTANFTDDGQLVSVSLTTNGQTRTIPADQLASEGLGELREVALAARRNMEHDPEGTSNTTPTATQGKDAAGRDTVVLTTADGVVFEKVFDDNGKLVALVARDKNGTAVVRTVDANGRTVATNIKLANNPFYIDFSDVGGVLGQQLGLLLAGGDKLVGIVTSAALQTLGDNLGDVLDGLVGGKSVNVATEEAFSHFGPELLANLKSAGIGAVSTFLTAELVKAIGVDGFAGELLNSAAGTVINSVITNIVNGAALFNGISAAQIGTAIGSFLGNKLANEVIQFDTIGGQLGSAIGSTLAVLAISMAVGGPPGLVLAFAAAFIGNIVGGLIGSLFGGIPRSGADVAWDDAGQQFVVANVYSRKGGSKDAARNMATAVAQTFNSILTSSGGALMNGALVQSGNYGMRKSDFVYRPTATRDKHAITQRFSGEDGMAKMIGYGVYQGLSDADFRIAGGDVWVKRALYNSLELPGVDALTFDATAILGNIAMAQRYEVYLLNQTIISSLISAQTDSVFTAEWAVVFARAVELGLTKRHESDWYGGFTQLLGDAQSNAANLTFAFTYDPFSDRASRILDFGTFALEDSIDIAGQTQIEGTDAGETIALTHEAMAIARGGNLVTSDNWPDEESALPSGPASVPGWQNPANLSDDGGWAKVLGPDGRETIVIEAANGADGGNATNNFTIDDSKVYEFTFYFQYGADGAGAVRFGLSEGASAYVRDAVTGAAAGDPWFFAGAAAEEGAFETDRWYKVVGYVLPENHGAIAAGSLGGVFDTVTGDKVADANVFRWNEARANDSVVARFEGAGGGIGGDASTYFGRPEVRAVSEAAVINGADRLANTLGLRINGMDSDGAALSIDVAATIDAGGGDDIVHGGDMGSNVFGGDGNDTLYGGRLDDWLIGGAGNDTLDAGSAAAGSLGGDGNYLGGDAGDDILRGREGSDWLDGGEGVDTLEGGGGGDVLTGGAGDGDTLHGGHGDDTYLLRIGDGDDTAEDEAESGGAVAGGSADPLRNRLTMLSTPGHLLSLADWIGEGDWAPADSSSATSGPAVLVNGGEDRLSLGVGIGLENIRLVRGGAAGSGTTDNDLIIELLATGEGPSVPSGDRLLMKDWFNTYKRIEWLELADGQAIRIGDFETFIVGTSGNDEIIGTAGRDFAVGGDGNDTMHLLTGDDIGVGGAGSDWVWGDEDNDLLVGGNQDDHVMGGSGNDILSGDSGADEVDGGEGNDVLSGGRGDNDLLTGGAGNDTFRYSRGDGRDTFIDAFAETGSWETVATFDGTGWSGYGGYIFENGQLSYDNEPLYDGNSWAGHVQYDPTAHILRRFVAAGGGPLGGDLGDTGDAIEFGLGINIQDLMLGRDGDNLYVGISQENAEVSSFASLSDWIKLDGWYVEANDSPIEKFVFAATGVLDTASTKLYGGSDGDDEITGTSAKEWITGNSGDDTIDGGAGNDILVGNSGSDTLAGGAGDDVLYGGAGNDTFNDGSGADIMIGGDGDDTVSYAHLATGVAVYLSAPSVNWGTSTTVQFSSIENITGSTASDMALAGDDGDNVITGGAGNDNLFGGGGDDTYVWNIGDFADTIDDRAYSAEALIGPSGEWLGGDRYEVTWEELWTQEEGPLQGTKMRLRVTNIETGEIVYNFQPLLEYAEPMPDFADWDDSGWRNGFTHLLNGVNLGDGVARQLFDDTVDAGILDAIELGEGISLTDLTFERDAARPLDLLIRYQGGLYEFLRISNQDSANSHIEWLELNDGLAVSLANLQVVDAGGTLNGSAEGDFLVGRNAAADIISGGDGDDVISGLSGDDILSGGAGDDIFEGGAGADQIDGGANSTGYKTSGDTVRYVLSDGVTINLGNTNQTGGDAQGDVLTGIENVVGSRTGIDVITGNEADNRLAGLGGNDILTGLGGMDVLDGGAGDDALTGGAGEDNIVGGDGADTLYGNDDNDFLDGGAGVDVLDGGAGDDQLIGGADNDQLVAGAGDDTLGGGDGADVLDGGDGKDTLSGDAGNDQLSAGAGDDMLDGGSGIDSLTGGDGKDSLTGGIGNDQLEGGAGDDSYLFGSGHGEDRIVDAAGKNKIRFDASVDRGRIWLEQVGNDLVVTLLGSTDKIVVEGYFNAQNPTLINAIVTTTHFLSLANAGPLIAAMTDFDPATDDIATINAMVASSWHEGETSAPTGEPIALVTDEDAVTALTSAGVVDADNNITGYALGTAAAHGVVNINAQTGEFTYTPAANFHGADAFSIVATDADGNHVDVAVSVTVNSVNDAPTGLGIAGGGSLSVSEAAAAGTVVGQLAATDLDGDTLTYTLLNDAGGRFAITAAGELSFDGSPSLDYEANGAHLIQVQVSDDNGGIVVQDFSVAVTDANEAPDLPATHSFQVAEGSAVGAVVGTAVQATDPDAGANGQLVYSFLNGGNVAQISADNRYAIDAVTGVITVNAALDYEAGTPSQTYTVAVRDNQGNAGALQDTSAVTIAITDLNEAPDLPASYGFQIAENSTVGTVVGTAVQATDPDAGANGQLVYSFLNGGNVAQISADNRYAIDAVTGVITVHAALDYEAATPSQTYTVAVRDNQGNAGALQDTSTVTIAITDLNEAPDLPASYGFQIAENSTVGTVVGTAVQATDPDAGANGQLRYGFLSGANLVQVSADNRYAIDAVTGVITVHAALDYEAATPSQTYTVAVRDNQGNAGALQDTSAVTIAITDVNEAPDFAAASYAFPIDENVELGTSVGTVHANDPDAPGSIFGEQHYYFIDGGVVSATSSDYRYVIDELTGEIRTNATLNFEGGAASGTYQVAARDNGGQGSYNQDVVNVTVTVQNLNEANHFVQPSYDFSLAENNALGATVGTVKATDEDGSTHAFAKQRYYFDHGQGSVSTVSHDSRYLINMYTGVITANTVGNYEAGQTTNSYDVVARDNNGNSGYNEDHTTVTIAVTNVNEAPVFGASSYAGSHDENAVAGLVVATVAASDPDEAGTPWAELRYSFRTGNPISGYTYSETSFDNRYRVDAVTGEVSVNGATDYEAAPSQTYTVAARDNSGESGALTGTTSLTIGLNNLNEANAIAPAYGFAIDENLAVGATVGAVAATDFDSAGHVFGLQCYYFLNGTEAESVSADGRYAIDAVTGVITAALAPNYEAGNPVADYVVIARDNAGGGAFNQVQTIVTIGVSNLNEAGQFTSDAYYTMSVTENIALGTLVGAVAVDDPDAPGTAFAEQRYFFTWGNLQSSTVSATSQDGRYIIDELTGEIRINGAIDFENMLITQVYKVLARDNGGEVPFNARTGFVEINVYNADDAPAPIQWTPNPTLSVIDERDHISGSERLAVAIGTLLVPDQDAFGSDWNNYDFTLSDGRFQVSNGILELKADESLDYETETEVTLIVTATLHGNPAVTLSREVILQVGDVIDVQEGDGTDETLIGQQNRDEISGFGGADTLYGMAGGDLLEGGTGNDRLFGGDGDDTLVGGEGDDVLTGGAGIDALDGGAGTDSADYSDAAAGVTADLDAPQEANLGDALGDSYEGIENLTGSAFDDHLYGDEFVNVIDGGAGNDTLVGRGADDTLIGGDGDDTLIGGDGVDVLLGGAGNDHLYGDGSGDQLDGGIGDDIIYGGAGNDDLIGGDGDDHLFAEGENDRLIGGAGTDEMTGGEGDDTYIVDRLSGSDTIFNFDHGGVDTLGMGEEVDPRDVWFERAAGTDDLLIKVIGTDTVIRVSRWFEPDWLTEEQRASFKIDLVGAGPENAPDVNVDMLVTWMSARTMPATAEDHDIMLANDPDYRVAWELAWVENLAPTLAEIGDVVIDEASGAVTVTLVADDSETDNGGLDYSHAIVAGGSLIESVGYGEVRPDGTRDLIITPFAHASGTVTIRVIVKDGNGAPVERSFDIDILPTVETPIISQFVGGPGPSGETPGIPITLDIDFADTDGSEIHTVRIGGLPLDLSLSAGTRDGDGTWLLSGAQLAGLRLLTPQNWFQDLELTATAYAQEAGVTETSAVATATIVVNAAPTWFSGTYSSTINENVATGTVLGTIQGVDPDGDATTVTLIDNGGGRFALDANGVLTIANGALFDYEAATWVQTTIRVTDASGRFTDFDPVFWINNVNEPNALPTTLTFSVDENVATNTSVGTVTASDLDAPTSNYSAQRYYILNPATGALSQMTPDGRFGIGQLNGVISTYSGSPNYEATPNYTFTVVAVDNPNGSPQNQASTTVTVNVNNINEAPTNITLSGSVSENAPNGTLIATLVTTDPEGGAMTYTLLDNAGGRFALSAAGQLTVANGTLLNFENAASHAINVRVTDSGGLWLDKSLTIPVLDVNEANAIPATYSFNVNENVANGTAVGTVTATDPDSTSPFNSQRYYFLNSGSVMTTTMDGRFAINTLTGAITTTTVFLDYETYTGGTFTVIARDNGGNAGYNQATTTVTIGVNNLNEANAIPATYGFNVNENVATGTAVGTVAATDIDSAAVAFGQQRYYFSNSGTAAPTSADGRFTINATTGVITTAAALNYETFTGTSYTIIARDNQGNAGYTQASSTVTIGVNNLNEANALPATYGFNVNENVATGTAVGTVTATDADTSGAFIAQRYYFSNSGTAAPTSADGRFTINATTGVITTAAALNYETFTGTNYTVIARDNLGNAGYTQATSTVTIGVNNLNEANALPATYGFNVNENVATGTTVGTVAATDADTSSPFNSQRYWFSNSGTAAATSADGRFTINNTTGVITTATALDYETFTGTNYTVIARDNQGNAGYTQATSTVTIGVNNLNEANWMPSTATLGVNENVAIGTVVGTAVATDIDTSSPFNSQRYWFSNSGTPSAISLDGRFAINNTTGVITTAMALDYETFAGGTSYTVFARDNQGNAGYNTAFTITTINVNNVNEQNSMPGSYGFGVNENVGIGTAVGTVAATDPDSAAGAFGQQRYYFWNGSAFVSTSTDGRYTLNATTGAITTAAALNYEAGNTSVAYAVYALDNQAAGGYTQSGSTVTIGINNLNDQNSMPGSYSFGVSENVGIGTVVGTVTATDPDTSSPFNSQRYYFWNGSAFVSTSSDGRYAINATTGAITTAAALNFEAGTTSVAYAVYALDNAAAGGYTQSGSTVTISIADANDQNSMPGSYSFGVSENVGIGTAVGTVTASDPDASSPFNAQRYYFWNGSAFVSTSADGRYSINATTGAITTAAALNFEAGTTSVAYAVYALDNAAGGGYTQSGSTVTIGIADANEQNSLPGSYSFGVYENVALGTAVGTVTASDPDTSSPFNSQRYYFWNGSAFVSTSSDGRYAIDATTGVITTAAALNYEAGTTSVAYTVYALDNQAAGGYTQAATTVTIGIADLNEAPSAGSTNSTFQNYAANNALVSTISASDPDGGTVYTYTIVSVTNSNEGSGTIADYRIYQAGGNVATINTTHQMGNGGWRNRDHVTIRVTDQGGLWYDTTFTVTYNNAIQHQPIVLDLDGDGVELVSSLTSDVYVDMNGDGVKDRTGWVAADDALLALDRNGDGIVTDMGEISFVGDLPGAVSDLEGLAAHDSDHDGTIDADDAAYGSFMVWQDENQDGISQATELRTLAQAGIAYISLTLNRTGEDPATAPDNVIYSTSEYVLGDGTRRLLGDVMLSYEPGQAQLAPPVILDLDGNGVTMTDLAGSAVRFDMDGDGIGDRTGWVGAADGLLALDRNADGTINGISEISFVGDLDGARTDLEGLRAFDSNHDGLLSPSDARYADFRVWIDADQNGVSNAGELKRLPEVGVLSIDLDATPTGNPTVNGGNVVYNLSSFRRGDGSTGVVGDVGLAFVGSATGALENSGTNQALPQQYAFDRRAKRYQIETKSGQIFVQPRIANGTTDPAVGGIDSAASLMFRDGAMGLGGAVVLDLDGDGIELTKRKKSHARFDMNADGVADDTGWVAKSDGILVLDRNGNGIVDGAGETSFIGDMPGAKSAFEGLQAFDSNRDGTLDAKDDKFGEFRVWQDLNGNGLTDGGEMKTLEEAGIASIGLDRRANDRKWKRDQNIVASTATFTRTDGSTGTAGDVAFAYKPSAGPASAEPGSDMTDQLRALRSGLEGWTPAHWRRFTEVGFGASTPHVLSEGGPLAPTTEMPGADVPIAANDDGFGAGLGASFDLPELGGALPAPSEGGIETADTGLRNFASHGRLAYLVQQMAGFGARSGETMSPDRPSDPHHHDYFAA